MTDATIGKGVAFKRGDAASPEVFTAIAEVIGVGGPNMQRDTVEATHTDSANNYREFISGLRDGGEVTLALNHLPGNATQQSLRTDYDADTAVNYQVIFPDTGASQADFAAFVTAIEPDTPIDDRMVSNVTFKITGKPIFS